MWRDEKNHFAIDRMIWGPIHSASPLYSFRFPTGDYRATGTDPVTLATGQATFSRSNNQAEFGVSMALQAVRSLWVTVLPPPGAAEGYALAGWKLRVRGLGRMVSLAQKRFEDPPHGLWVKPRSALFDMNLSGETHNLVVPLSVGNQLDQDLSTFFHLHPVFSRLEVIGFLADRGTTHPGTVDSLLRHHVGRGHILRVRQGLYASVPPGATPETAPADPFLLASRAQEGAVIAYHSALGVHGLAYSTFEVLSYVAPRPAGP